MSGGLFLEMLGNDSPHALQGSFQPDSQADRCLTSALRALDPQATWAPYRTIIDNDERQFNAPGVRVPMLSLSRVEQPTRQTPASAPTANTTPAMDTPAIVIPGAPGSLTRGGAGPDRRPGNATSTWSTISRARSSAPAMASGSITASIPKATAACLRSWNAATASTPPPISPPSWTSPFRPYGKWFRCSRKRAGASSAARLSPPTRTGKLSQDCMIHYYTVKHWFKLRPLASAPPGRPPCAGGRLTCRPPCRAGQCHAQIRLAPDHPGAAGPDAHRARLSTPVFRPSTVRRPTSSCRKRPSWPISSACARGILPTATSAAQEPYLSALASRAGPRSSSTVTRAM